MAAALLMGALATEEAQSPKSVLMAPNGQMLVDGRPFFPFGFFLGPSEDEDLGRIADAGFNTVLCYRYGASDGSDEFMDRAHRYGLKVVFSLKDFYEGTPYFPEGSKSGLEWAEEKVKSYRSHPALLAWYVNDELEPEWIDRIRTLVDRVRSLDPNHPTFQVLCSPKRFSQYQGITDVLGVDPYPIPGRPISLVSEWADKARDAVGPGKPVWVVPQVFDWRIYRDLDPSEGGPGEPTLEQKRAMAFLAIVHGARGLLFYSYFDLQRGPKASLVPEEVFLRRWEEMKTLSAEIGPLLPALAYGPARLVSYTPEEIHAGVVGPAGGLWLVAINSSQIENASRRLTLPAGYGIGGGPDEGGTSCNGGFVDLSLKPLGVCTMRLLPCGVPQEKAP